MKRSKFTETQIVKALKKHDSGRKAEEISRELGISTATFYKWKERYGGLEASDLKKMKDFERQNLTMRMSMRRFTRLTNGFSKKIENHFYAIALHFVYYNFARPHKTLKTSPAFAAGILNEKMTIEDIVLLTEKYHENSN